MYASIDNSTYIESPVTVADALTHEHTMTVSLPDLGIQSPSTIDFITSFAVVDGDPILVFSSEFPDGLQDVAGVVVDNLDGTWTVPFTAVLTQVPTFVYDNPSWSGYPDVDVQGTDAVTRIIHSTETLTYVSATDIQFVGTSARAGMLRVGDTIASVYNDTVEDVPVTLTLTGVTEAGVEPSVTYTCDFAITPYALNAVNATIAARSSLVPLAQVTGSTTGGNVTKVMNFSTTVTPGGEIWNFLSRRIVSPRGWNIIEPFVMDYTEEIPVV
ncbi:MAG: hypothetical protein DRP58_03240 [Spirochaetes bacterium]|nr:MAG: hypothetical protein DRP58_03240 [Spirochaetota bacterium]